MIGIENYFLLIIGLIWIIIAVIQDLRKREIANWWNFSLIAIGLVYQAAISVYTGNYFHLLYGVMGFAIFFVLAYAFYYGRVFAGGDAKLLMGLGAVLAFSGTLMENLTNFLYFTILFLVCGSIYGLAYSIGLALRRPKKFGKEFIKQAKKAKKFLVLFIFLALMLSVFVIIMGQYIFLALTFCIFIFPILYAYAKAVEECCLVKEVEIKNLTVGDWLYKPVKIGKKIIRPNWEGLSEEELAILKKHKGKVIVKEGIPFTPSFLFAYIILLWVTEYGLINVIYSLGII
jgi:Flp pilus assembly protein protease CpaA